MDWRILVVSDGRPAERATEDLSENRILNQKVKVCHLLDGSMLSVECIYTKSDQGLRSARENSSICSSTGSPEGAAPTEGYSVQGQELPPLAPSLMGSLRSVGYSVGAALADLVDNSIAAGADNVAISFSTHPEPHLAVLDNGVGMNGETLVSAMRFGSRDPRDQRGPEDLGRFGLGMKTASLSQCRRLTVATLADGVQRIAEWDLDECESRGSWWLGMPGPEALPSAHAEELASSGRGTLVLWRNLDRLLGAGTGGAGAALDAALEDVPVHLGFIFHRFLGGASPSLAISVNGRRVPDFDPFLEGHPRGQSLHEETFRLEGHTVGVTPFVLPFPSRLSPSERERSGGDDRLRTGHGFYVYRGRRLVVPGGWFRIVPSNDLVRLARIRVDVPTGLDHLWKVDIRKTVLEPPRELRDQLRRLVGTAASRSRKVYQFRGSSGRQTGATPVWIRRSHRERAVSWEIDREHPAVRSLMAGETSDVERLFRLLESTLPYYDIHVHMAGDVSVEPENSRDELEREMDDLIGRVIRAFGDDPDLRTRLLEGLDTIEPFNRDPELARRLAARHLEGQS